MIYGYARVSTKEQNLDTQIEQLKDFKCDLIIKEKHTGSTFQRSELDGLLRKLQKGDKLVITRVDRLGRNTKQLLDMVEDLQGKEISLFIIELGMEVTNRNGKLFLTILSALAENELELLREKQANGIAMARSRGVKLGRKGKPKGQVEHALDLWLAGSYTVKEIESMTDVPKSVLYREKTKRGLERVCSFNKIISQ